MTQQRWDEVDRYLSQALLPPDPVLDATLQASVEAGLPPGQVSACQGRLLEVLAAIQGATAILEIGALGGYSAICLARGLRPGGRLVTLEVDPTYAEVARANFTRAGLDDVVELRLGRAIDTLDQLIADDQGPFDVVFIDADKPSNPEYLARVLELTRPGSLIIADNVIREGAVADPTSTDPKVQGVRRFNEMMGSDPRLVATAIQTVGTKGYDGFALAYVSS